MKLLLDTHLLLWTVSQSRRLSASARTLIGDSENQLAFSAASLWELAIKRGLGRSGFEAESRSLRRGLLDNPSAELPVTGAHAIAVASLPPIHRDPFDRVLVA